VLLYLAHDVTSDCLLQSLGHFAAVVSSLPLIDHCSSAQEVSYGRNLGLESMNSSLFCVSHDWCLAWWFPKQERNEVKRLRHLVKAKKKHSHQRLI
jgi:hypothetical protein